MRAPSWRPPPSTVRGPPPVHALACSQCASQMQPPAHTGLRCAANCLHAPLAGLLCRRHAWMHSELAPAAAGEEDTSLKNLDEDAAGNLVEFLRCAPKLPRAVTQTCDWCLVLLPDACAAASGIAAL